jgi:hypothetical protein
MKNTFKFMLVVTVMSVALACGGKTETTGSADTVKTETAAPAPADTTAQTTPADSVAQ